MFWGGDFWGTDYWGNDYWGTGTGGGGPVIDVIRRGIHWGIGVGYGVFFDKGYKR
jgi:hypothetical protein